MRSWHQISIVSVKGNLTLFLHTQCSLIINYIKIETMYIKIETMFLGLCSCTFKISKHSTLAIKSELNQEYEKNISL